MPIIPSIADERAVYEIPMSPNLIVSSLPSTIDYESQDAKDESEYQVCWSNVMDKGSYKNPSTYQKAEVLLLCWATHSDNLATGDEVERLKLVFEERFHYNTRTEYISTKTGPNLQVQINGKIAAFVADNDGPHTLLVVYYAGHGRPGSYYGALELHNGSDLSDNNRKHEEKKEDKIIWNMAEDLLKPAEADILEIFDCCYAGTVGQTRGDKRYFEYLAATGPMGGTPVPGRDSFTSALIHALEHLVNHKAEGRFTTVELLNRIKDDSPDFPKDQTPVLSDRKRVGPGGRLMLHPIHPESTKTQIIPSQSPHLESAKMQTVTLHFDFSEKPPLENIEALGLELNKVCEHNSLRVNGVRWGGLKQSMTARAIQSFRQIFLRGRQRRASELREQESILSDCGEEYSAHHTPEPPTPSSTSQHSPPIQETLITTDSVIDPTHLSPVLASKRNYDSGNQGQGRAKRRKIASKGRDS